MAIFSELNEVSGNLSIFITTKRPNKSIKLPAGLEEALIMLSSKVLPDMLII